MLRADNVSRIFQQPKPTDRVARNARHAIEHVHLRKNLLALIRVQSHLHYVGKSWSVAQIAVDHGFQPEDLVIVRMEISAVAITAIVVPGRIWHRRLSKAALFSVKRMAEDEGIRCLLIPEGVIRRQPCLENSRLISSAMSTKVSISARMTLVSYLIENGSSSLTDCSSILGGEDPFSGVLHLVALGVLQIELLRPIGPHSLVHLPGGQL